MRYPPGYTGRVKMHPGTGHLVNLESEMAHEVFGKPVTYEKVREKGYEPVPPELERAAQKKLAGKNEATVSLTSGGKLSKWAAGRRNERKVRNRMVKNSRRQNRDR